MEENQELVRNMLNKLEDIGHSITWNMNNSYTDGIDKTIFELRIYENGLQAGRIAYQAETGQVLNYRYKNLEKRLPVQISDIMLDIIGIEMNASKEVKSTAY